MNEPAQPDASRHLPATAIAASTGRPGNRAEQTAASDGSDAGDDEEAGGSLMDPGGGRHIGATSLETISVLDRGGGLI